MRVCVCVRACVRACVRVRVCVMQALLCGFLWFELRAVIAVPVSACGFSACMAGKLAVCTACPASPLLNILSVLLCPLREIRVALPG